MKKGVNQGIRKKVMDFRGIKKDHSRHQQTEGLKINILIKKLKKYQYGSLDCLGALKVKKFHNFSKEK